MAAAAHEVDPFFELNGGRGTGSMCCQSEVELRLGAVSCRPYRSIILLELREEVDLRIGWSRSQDPVCCGESPLRESNVSGIGKADDTEICEDLRA
jgi:hypothetical protein